MLSTISGTVASLAAHSVVVEVSGIGFEIAITPRHSLKLSEGSTTTLQTRLIVREDDLSLYGFQDAQERALFDLLCSVSGIGPKLALTVLAGMDAESLAQAVATGNEAAFRAISGIGPKTAKLILISLGGKVSGSSSPTQQRVVEALIQLGTDEARARDAVAKANGDTEAELLKHALAQLTAGKMR